MENLAGALMTDFLNDNFMKKLRKVTFVDLVVNFFSPYLVTSPVSQYDRLSLFFLY